MDYFLESILVLVLIILISRLLKRRLSFLQKLFIPSSLVAGLLGLFFGPQIVGLIPGEITDIWSRFPKYLIIVVFAGLFLGKKIPTLKELWRLSGPMVAFGNTLAWGQYFLGLLVTILILTPFFGVNPLAGVLIEIGFEGGHGTAAGLGPTFESLGWAEGVDVALAMATVSIFAAIISGLVLTNWRHRTGETVLDDRAWEKHRQKMVRSGYNLLTFIEKFSTTPGAIFVAVIALAVSIGLGWLFLKSLIFVESITLSRLIDFSFFPYVPLFPLAMIGGLVLQIFLNKFGKRKLVKRRTVEIIGALSLDVLVASAVATVSLRAVSDNLAAFVTLTTIGVAWIIFGFLFLAPRMFSGFWFEKGLTNIGQSMGMTATGLLLNRLVDPSNKTKSKESFAYKQLAFEPFMGGGMITATSLILVYNLGSGVFLVLSLVSLVFWLVLGLRMGRKKQVD